MKATAISVAIFAIGCGAGAVNYELQRAHVGTDLVHDAQTAGVSFRSADLRQLTGTRADLGTEPYADTKRRLQELKATDPRARYVYLFRAEGGRVIFLADSTPIGARDESLPGDAYPEAGWSPGLQEIIRTGKPALEGPLRDRFGTWVTAYTRVGGDNAGPGAAPRTDVLGIDIAANEWNRELWLAAFRGALYVWTLLAFPVFAFLSTRRQGEQRDAIRNLSEAVEQSHSAIMILDLEQRIEYANRGLCRQIGYGRRQLIGRHWRELIAGPASNPAVSDLVAAIRTGRIWEGEWTNLRKDGTEYPVHGMVTPVKHRDGSLACFVAIFDDVSDVKRKEAELREARDLAEAGDRAKSHFLATMSHEVRTPLNGIVGFTSLLLDTPLSAEQREFVQTIRASGESLIQLTGDILDFARIESGKLKLDPAACDPRECIEEALDLHATKAAEKNVELLHRAADDVPAAVIVDAGRLRQVLVNLVGNAVKFTERGEVEVTVAVRDTPPAVETATSPAPPASGDGEPRVTLEFAIRDTGIGIAPELHSRLFKPFSQLDESSTRRYGGAGLGLAICKNLVQLMDGDIAVTSHAGAGTVFTFTVRVPVAAPHPPPRQLTDLRVGLAIRPGSLRRELVELLTSWGATVEATDGPAELASQNCDVALVEVCNHVAQDLASRGRPLSGLPPAKTLALVPISLASELRHALRSHFRLLINRPVHHGPFFALLSGERPVRHQATPSPAVRYGFRVLVVEDNHINQRLVQRVLTGLGCTHTVAANGFEAIAELQRAGGEIDLVMLDLHMPELDGLAALERIRRGDAGDAARAVWIIAVTADVRPEQRERGFAMGLNDYLTKPLRVGEFEQALERFRTRRASR